MRWTVVLLTLMLAVFPLYAQDNTAQRTHTFSIRSGNEFDSINGVSWSADGSQVLAWAGNNQLYVWNADSGRRVFNTEVTGRGWWNADDSHVITYDYTLDEVAAWDIDSGNVVYRIPNNSPLDVISPNGQLLLTTEPDTAYIRDIATGEIVHTLEDLPFNWFWLDATMVGANDTQQFQVWDAETGEQINSFRYEGFIADYTNELLLTSQASVTVRIQLYNIQQGEELRTYRVNGGVSQMRLSSNGDFIYVVARENADSSERLLVWNIDAASATSIRPATDDETRIILEFAPSPDETQVMTVTFELDADTAQIVEETERATVWDMPSGDIVLDIAQEGVTQGAWSPDGDYLAVWGNMGGSLWDVAPGEMLAEFGDEELVSGVAFSPDSSQMATWSGKTMTIWTLP